MIVDGKHYRYSLATSADVIAIFDDEAAVPSTAVVAVFDRDQAKQAEAKLDELNKGGAAKRSATRSRK